MKLRNGSIKLSAIVSLLVAVLSTGAIVHGVGGKKQMAPLAPTMLLNPMQADGSAPPPPVLGGPGPKSLG